MARLVGRINTMFLQVIEVKDNGKYLTAGYNKSSSIYGILDIDVILADICNTSN